MRKALIFLSIFLIGALSATLVEYSPTANALNGITLLSDSVTDYSLSPVLALTGISSFYQRPFNTSEIAVLGFGVAAARNRFIFAGGTTYLHHSDYSWHNPFLNLSYNYYGISVGTSGHMVYDSVQDEDSRYDFSWDLGARYGYKDYGAEVKIIRIGSEDEQLAISMKAELSEGIGTSTSYVYETGGNDFFRAGLHTEINKYLAVFGSWQNEPNRFGFGLRFGIEPWSLMYSIRTHPQLDVSHGISLDIDW